SPLSDGDRTCSTPGPPRCPSFNGAVASQRRRQRRRLGVVALGVASMEPSPLSDGDSSPSGADVLGRLLLQWSRRLSATETPGLVAFVVARLGASMEPSPLSDGDRLRRREGRRVVLASMEPSPLSVGDAAWIVSGKSGGVLQWSRRLSATE